MRKFFPLLFLLNTIINNNSSAQLAGSLDTTFGLGGKVLLNIPGGFRAIALQTDGKIVIAGGTLVGRLNTDGSLDTTFSQDGWDTVSVPGSDYNDVAIQPDGKIVAAGSKITVRYTTTGNLDNSFGNGGKIGASYTLFPKLAIQPNGKIIILNFSWVISPGISLTRFNANGTQDLSFGTNGHISHAFFNTDDCSEGHDLILQPDGKIIVAGEMSQCDHVTSFGGPILARFNTDGSLDSSFGDNGIFQQESNNYYGPFEPPSENKFICSVPGGGFASTYIGNYFDINTIDYFYNIGHPDDWVSTYVDPMLGEPGDLASQSDGKIVVVTEGNYDFTLLRCQGYYPDSSFGSNGIVITDFGILSKAFSLVIQADGKIVVVGYAGSNTALARYNNCGATPSTVSPCTGLCNGSIYFSNTFGSSPFTYVWSTGDTISFIDSLCAGDYSVIITDSSGCISNQSFTIQGPVAFAGSTDVSCFGSCDGSAIVSLYRGTPSFSYSWNNGDTTDAVLNLCSGMYTVVVTDSNQCIDTISVNVSQPSQLLASSVSVYNPTCTGCSDGYIVFSDTGGILPYVVSWIPSSGQLSGDTILLLPADIYTITITDDHGCIATFIDTLTDQPNLIRSSSFPIGFEISPNPNNGKFEINSLASEEKEIVIYNFLGNLVFEAILHDSKTNLNLEMLPSGLYFTRLRTSKGSVVQKLIIE